MLYLTLKIPGGDELHLDTADPKLIGPWLTAIFDSLQINPKNNWPDAIEFRLVMR